MPSASGMSPSSSEVLRKATCSSLSACRPGFEPRPGVGATECASHVCDPERDRDTCCVNIDDCASQQCSGHGACSDGLQGYSCACVTGYSGVDCQVRRSGCDSQPCSHGVCIENATMAPGAFLCSCDAGFAGALCDVDVDACANGDECQNSATCVDASGNSNPAYTCSCTAGWTGLRCGASVDDCASAPCGPHGTCSDQHLGYVCSCDSGYFRRDCDDTPLRMSIGHNVSECGGPALEHRLASSGMPGIQ